MTPRDLIDALRSRINPAYANTLGTESYERRLCADALDTLLAQRDTLLSAAQRMLDENGHLADGDNCTLIVLKRAVEMLAEVGAGEVAA